MPTTDALVSNLGDIEEHPYENLALVSLEREFLSCSYRLGKSVCSVSRHTGEPESTQISFPISVSFLTFLDISNKERGDGKSKMLPFPRSCDQMTMAEAQRAGSIHSLKKLDAGWNADQVSW